MKRLILSIFTVCCAASISSAQTTATNWTATDCNAISHTLFTELDAGKVVVFVWIMPCGTCISDAKAAYDAVASFSSSHPGKVVYYLSDDVGDAGCSTLNSWATNNGMMGATTFSNAGNTMNEDDYGGPGMPHVVVMGGTNHEIFLNLRGGSNNFTAIRNAIESALGTTAVGGVNAGISDLKISPIPASDNIKIGCAFEESGILDLDIFDLRGVKVQSLSLYKSSGRQNIDVHLNNALGNGYYMLHASMSGVSRVAGFTVSR